MISQISRTPREVASRWALRLRSLPLKTKLIVIAIALAALGATLSFGPVVRSRVNAEAERRGVRVTIDRVSPGWFSVHLEGVGITPEGTHTINARIEEVTVDLTAGFSVRDVWAKSAHVDVTGSFDDVMLDFEEWKKRHAGTTATEVGTRRPFTIDGMSIAWKGPDASLDATGMSVRRDDTGTHIAIEALDSALDSVHVHVGTSNVDLDPKSSIDSAHATEVTVSIAVKPAENPTMGASSASAGLPPPPPPPSWRHSSKATEKKEEFVPFVTLPNLHAWRVAVAALGPTIDQRLPDGARASVDALTLEIARGSERVTIGPGSGGARREHDEVILEFETRGDKSAGAAPLALLAHVPLGRGDVVVSLSGGPVSLSMLGVAEGAFGLVDVARARVSGKGRLVLDDAGETLSFDQEISVAKLSVSHPRLATEPVRNVDLRLLGRGALSSKGELRLDDAEATLGAIHFRVHGGIEQTSDHLMASLSFDVPVAGCQSLLDSVPAALVPHIAGARYRGTFGGKGFFQFDTRKLDDLTLKYDWSDECMPTSVPDQLDKDRLMGAFTYAVVDKDGKPADRRTGHGTEEWTDILDISPFMQAAVLTTEDGSFLHHHGFNHEAIRQSLVANLKAHAFVRGASTITMQLAKNLFLSRDKIITRKLEEILLADYLEKTLKKDEMMEMYLNIIEFGPDIYGVGAASSHFFGRKPSELTLAESLFLASLLPSPRTSHRIYEKGEVPETWMKTIHYLMTIAQKTGKISQAELDEGVKQTIILHKPGEPLPPPRAAIRGAHLFGDDDWDVVGP